MAEKEKKLNKQEHKQQQQQRQRQRQQQKVTNHFETVCASACEIPAQYSYVQIIVDVVVIECRNSDYCYYYYSHS